MTSLYLDIETVGAQTDDEKARIAATVKTPGNLKKAETIAAWEKDTKPQVVAEAIDKSSFNGAVGHIVCIGWAIDEQQATYALAERIDDERAVLNSFIDHMDRKIARGYPTIVGHYVAGFDIRFITQRAIVLGVKLPYWWPKDPKPWSKEVFDTMTAWAGSKDTISLDNLCAALGIEGKGDIDGSMIGELWANGEFGKISTYCVEDVERVRRIHQKMLQALGEAA